MIYAQEKHGQKLHLAYEAGEGRTKEALIPAGSLGQPLCGRKVASYRMSINMPLGEACKNCRRVQAARHC